MAQVPPRFYNQQLQERGDNYHHSKKNYYRAGTGGMSQEHQGSASQVNKIFFFLIFGLYQKRLEIVINPFFVFIELFLNTL